MFWIYSSMFLFGNPHFSGSNLNSATYYVYDLGQNTKPFSTIY